MKVMIFRAGETEEEPRLPAGATQVRVDRLDRCETNAACSPLGGIVACPPVMPWTSVISFVAASPVTAEQLEDLRVRTGAVAAVAVTAVDLLSVTGAAGWQVKNLGVLRRRPDATPDEFAEHWRDHHAPITLSYRPSFRRYVTNTVDLVAGEFPWDGVVEQYFASLEDLAMHVRAAQDGKRPLITADIPRFVSHMLIFAASPAELALSS